MPLVRDHGPRFDALIGHARGRRAFCVLPVLLCLVAACAPVDRGPRGPGPPPPPPPTAVGTLRADSRTVFVNERPVVGTVRIFPGDKVRTDNTGRATVFFEVGGTLTLDPNTDPFFELVNEVGCIIRVVIRYGSFDFANVTRVCCCDPENGFCAQSQSDFHIRTGGPSGATIAVRRGSVRVTVGNRVYVVQQGFSINVLKGKSPGPQAPIR